ncbi:glycoprotein endo-alpha-1,2-mannosidase-like protein [Lampetra fluviatilis]
MVRLRRKWLALVVFVVFVVGVMMGLGAVSRRADDDDGGGGGGGSLWEFMPRPRAVVGGDPLAAPARPAPASPLPAGPPRKTEASDGDQAASTGLVKGDGANGSSNNDNNNDDNDGGGGGDVNYDVHIFYYAWFGNPRFDGRYVHWNHALLRHWDAKVAAAWPTGAHEPPGDVAASFYPELGPYSSRDPAAVHGHMRQLRHAAAGVLVLSWYPPGRKDDNGDPVDDLVPMLLDAAHRHALKVTFHIEPYKNRDERSVRNDVKYIIDRYGSHPAFHRYRTSSGQALPLLYVYDSYLTAPDAWAEILTPGGAQSVRGTQYDAVFLALVVEQRHLGEIARAGFDGLYTYFATNGFSFGSSHHNWRSLKAFCDANGLLFVPSVGPGYADASVRPWNQQNARGRVHGRYYEAAFRAALLTRPEIISITSFNEWHEGTQIETAIPRKGRGRDGGAAGAGAGGGAPYLDYLPGAPDMYLSLTRKWAMRLRKEKQQWLM